jgi:HlyD family secretion protein
MNVWLRSHRGIVVTLLIVVGIVAILLGVRYFRIRPQVEVVRPERREVVELVIASGRLRAVRQSAIGAEVSSVVDEVLVQEGDRVRAGQRLLVLRQADVRQRAEKARLAVETARRELERVQSGASDEEIRRARAEVERAAAARDQAERDEARSRALFDRGLIARAELDRAETGLAEARAAERVAEHALLALRNQPRPEELHVAEARLREAEAALKAEELELAKRFITAPFNGLIVDRRVEPGQAIAAGTPLLTLAEMEHTELWVETDENNLSKLRPGQPAIAIAPSYPEQPFRAVLRQIGPEVDSARGVVELKLDPASLPGYARPDMTVDVNIEVARVPNALAVPATSLFERDGRTFVLTVQDGRARAEEVRLRGRNPEWAAVDGIDPVAQVIVRAAGVTPGQAVRVREKQSPR